MLQLLLLIVGVGLGDWKNNGKSKCSLKLFWMLVNQTHAKSVYIRNQAGKAMGGDGFDLLTFPKHVLKGPKSPSAVCADGLQHVCPV